MDFYLQLLFIPLIAGTIGWVTNKIAVLMLFHPKNPIKIIGIEVQGIFPKRQLDIANRIGEMVAENLLSHDVVKQKVFTTENINLVKNTIEAKLDTYLEYDLKETYPIASIFVSSKKRLQIKEKIVSEVDHTIADLQNNFETYLSEKVNIKEMVTEKIASLDSDEVNDLMTTVMKNELQFIEWIGAILGFLIGLIQVLIVNLV
ncbi:UPF0754 membrane protein [Flavobacteriaceae bacterium UJ101]|nr:UPF0754 membrane protein [Flavobacteriaceae bacterium UJ101]